MPDDNLLAELLNKHQNLIVDFLEHNSLLEHVVDYDLTEKEKKKAWFEWKTKKQNERIANEKLNNNLVNDLDNNIVNLSNSAAYQMRQQLKTLNTSNTDSNNGQTENTINQLQPNLTTNNLINNHLI